VIITVTPNPGLDLTYTFSDDEADGDVRRAERSTLEASGKGVNVSRALTAAGVATCAVLPSGGRTGRFLVELLAAAAVPYRAVPQADDVRINTTAVTSHRPTLKLNGPGARLTPSEQDLLVSQTARAADDAVAGGTVEVWVAVCGSLPPGADEGLVERLIEAVRAAGARCAVDTSGPALQAAIDAGADLIAPNRYELAVVAPEAHHAVTVRDVAVAARATARRTGVQLLVSLGAEGALYANGEITLHAYGPPLTPVNTAGAGDALLAGWFSTGGDDDPVERLRTAVAWGRSAVLSQTTVDLQPGRRDNAVVTVTDLERVETTQTRLG
jgi:1-phosphofructokinase